MQKHTNAARTTLASGITNVATSLTVAGGSGDIFPVANTGATTVDTVEADTWFKAVIVDEPTQVYEIIYVRTRAAASDTLSNIQRGQEGTTAQAFSAGATVALRLTAIDAERSTGVGNQWSRGDIRVARAETTVRIHGSATPGDGAYIEAEGVAADVPLKLTSKGAGQMTFGVAGFQPTLQLDPGYDPSVLEGPIVLTGFYGGTAVIGGGGHHISTSIGFAPGGGTLYGPFSGNLFIPCSSGNNWDVVLDGNVTVTFVNPLQGQEMNIRIEMDGTGGWTLTWPAGSKFAGSVNTGAGRVTFLTAFYNSNLARWEGWFTQIPA